MPPSAKLKQEALPRIQYGIDWAAMDDAYAVKANRELLCFREWHGPENGGLGRYRHFKNAVNSLYPETEWNDWMEWRAREFCDINNWLVAGDTKILNIASVGCAGSGKTHDWSLFAFVWWMAGMDISAVALCSIQKNMIRQRCWSVIQECYNTLPARPGNMVDSQAKLQNTKGDDKHSIFAQAVESGEANKAKQRIAGLHLPRVMIVVDEAPGTPEGIFEAVANITSGCSELIVASSGNALSRLDAHGRICEPVNGWNSIDQDTAKWETKGVREWKLPPGVCLHFHGKRSPNVKRAKTVYPYLYTYENWQAAKGNEDTLNYWTYDAGFWPPEGISNTVFDEATIQRVDGMGAFLWETKSEPVAALDPAFGGDECVFRLGTLGDISANRIALQVGESIPVKMQHKASKPVDYQIAEQVIERCNREGVKPENFVVGATGTGRGVAAILRETWSPLINSVEEGGSPSSHPVSADDQRECREVYDRRVTELYFNCKELLTCGQLKGLDKVTCHQFCTRQYEIKGKRYSVEPKSEYKLRHGRSPDDADCVVMMVDLAIKKGAFPRRVFSEKLSQHYMKRAIEADEVYQQAGNDPNDMFNSMED